MLTKLLHTFRHGVHPPESKSLTAGLEIRRLPFPEQVVLPLSQHAGKPARPLVAVGDTVQRGDKIAEEQGWVSSPVHASATGTVVAIDLWPHSSGSHQPAIRIDVDRYSAQTARPRMIPDWHDLTPSELVECVRQGGVVGLGGAAFPTHVKLVPPEGRVIEWLVLNGCECEPYLTTDHRTMVEYPERVHLGLRIMMKCLGVSRALIGVENNKPDALAALRRTKPADLDVEIMGLTVKYPQGAEKMLIKAVLDREVPEGGLPLDVGVVVQNVASVATIAEVFETGLPLIERIVTVTGPAVRKPANLIVPVGTKVRDLLDACGGLTDDAAEIVLGGPMMGNALGDLDAPVMKGTTGVVALRASDVRDAAIHPCIRCGHCLESCPVFLNPQLLGSLAKNGRLDEMDGNHLGLCMVCGCCSYVCPSNIPLSQMFGAAKSDLRRRRARVAAP